MMQKPVLAPILMPLALFKNWILSRGMTVGLAPSLSLAQSLRGDDVYGKEGKYPKVMSNFTKSQRQIMGEQFIRDTMMHRQNAPMFTDKMPNNFRHIARGETNP